ncbi:MAG TPA: hypothetical protein VFP92_02395 [Rhodanobacteraceae bacterium]|nr:hypothetical protein [Rhodanobacteraceae bacterium]
MNIAIRIAVAAALIAACAIAPARADSWVKEVGGDGGAQYSERCRQGQILNGFELRAGDDIDAIRAVCVTPSGPTTISAPPLSNGFGAGWHGGGGGGLRRVLCPPGTPVVVGVWLLADGRDTVSLDQIAIYCGEVSANWTSDSNFPSNQFFAPIQKDLCPPGLFSSCATGTAPIEFHPRYCPGKSIAIGMHGRSGALVDAMGLICGPAPVFAPPKPVVPAMGHTGSTLTPLQRATRGASVAPGTAAAVHAPAANLRPKGKAADLKVSTSAATDANRKAIIIVGGKPQEKKRPSTVLERIDGNQDHDHD